MQYPTKIYSTAIQVSTPMKISKHYSKDLRRVKVGERSEDQSRKLSKSVSAHTNIYNLYLYISMSLCF